MKKYIISLLIILACVGNVHAQAGMPTPPYGGRTISNMCGLARPCGDMLDNIGYNKAPVYVPTMAATPVAGTNDFKYGYTNVVPTAAANTAACLPSVPTPGVPLPVVNNGANAVRVKACGTPGIGTANTAGQYIPLAAGQRTDCVGQTITGPWQCSNGVVPTPAGP